VIKVTNNISANVIRTIALFSLRFTRSLRANFNKISLVIINFNRAKTQIPENLILAVITIEDKRYFDHAGIDFYSILRALVKNTRAKRIEGASTITQQLVRNTLNKREITIKRKINEILLSTLVSKEFSKEEIINAYLCTYNFNNCIGVYSLCSKENYNINNLSNNEAAQIAARFKYPSINKSNYINYLKRVRTIEVKFNHSNSLINL